MPSRFRETNNHGVIQQMYLEVLKKFEFGEALKTMDPVEDMEIEYDPTCDEVDINDLVKAKEQA